MGQRAAATTGDRRPHRADRRAAPATGRDGGAIGLVNVADEFFVAVRVQAGGERILISDVTAAVAWDLARQVVDRLQIETPGDDDLEDVWPAGDLSLFADLGVDEMELGAVLADLDAYADEMLLMVARRVGFDEAYDRALETVRG